MAVEMIDAGSVERKSTYAGDRSAPKIPYLDYYDAARSAREESEKRESSRTMTTTGTRFSAPIQSAGNGKDRQEQMVRQAESEEVTPQHSMTYREMLASKINEILEKIEAGATKPSFPIGAAYFTIKEWEIFIETFDKIQEEMKKEAGQEVPPEDTSVAAREEIGEDEDTEVEKETDLLLLLAENTSCSYPPAEKEEEEIQYRIYYTKEEIYCKRIDASGYEWDIPLEEESQYERIMEFLGQFEAGENLRFACHENFWRDFLDGTLDLDGFMEFMNTRVIDGIPNYVNVNEYGMWIDTEAARYAKYMNRPGLFQYYERVPR
ncbi:MAG: hypothetical protein K2J67_07415 [Lachnospiraceae bacterium]|nr:hypothetical protein [Lachnospiraceae bacterium]